MLFLSRACVLRRYFPTQVLNYMFIDEYRRAFVRPRSEVGFWKFTAGNLAAGGSAGATSLLFVYPLDVVRTRLAADVGRLGQPTRREFRGIGDCLGKILRSDGMAGLYRGFGVSVVGVVVYRAALFGGFDTMKSLLLSRDAPVWKSWLVAQTVTVGAAVLSYAFDTVRRRMMMQSGRALENIQYKTTIDCWRKIASEEGVWAYFKGGGANMIRATGGALVLVMYDEIKKIL